MMNCGMYIQTMRILSLRPTRADQDVVEHNEMKLQGQRVMYRLFHVDNAVYCALTIFKTS